MSELRSPVAAAELRRIAGNKRERRNARHLIGHRLGERDAVRLSRLVRARGVRGAALELGVGEVTIERLEGGGTGQRATVAKVSAALAELEVRSPG